MTVSMQKEILDYLATQRVGVLAVEMLDGSPHAATVHFAYSENPVIFYFETCVDYRKTESLTGRATSRASFVVGADESNMKTLQLDGEIRIMKPEEMDTFDSVYYSKFPTKKGKRYGSDPVFFQFVPTWWKFTDWTTPEGKKIWTSN